MSFILHSKIKEAIENDTLVFFIGSGTSAPLGFPTWDDLVIEILEELSSIEDEKLNRHKKLWEITSKIITTNYDTAL